MKRKLVIGDVHAPYTNLDTLTAIYSAIERERPKEIIQLGDLYDMFAQSSFPKTCQKTPSDELIEGRQLAESMWKHIKRIVPRASCYQLLGNHDIRPKKVLQSRCPELEPFFSVDQFFVFKGVKTILDERQELIIDEVCFMHGYKSKLGDHCRYNLMNTAVGHTHRGGTHFESARGKIIWELNAGFLADPRSKAMSYTKQTWSRWTQGYGVIDDAGPRFCPL